MRSPEQILSALPLRVRLTLVYTGVMAFVLAIVCVFLFLHTKSGIDQGIDDALVLRAHDVAAVARIGDPAQILLTAGPPPGRSATSPSWSTRAGGSSPRRRRRAARSSGRPSCARPSGGGSCATVARACACSPSPSAPALAWSSSAPTCPSASTRWTSSRARC
jgi:hypothetical protein